jgi:ribose-phosphate pyrophosphokinase
LKIIGGPGSLELARRLSESMNLSLVSTRTKRFPDGEFYFRFEENISGEDLLVVQSLYPPQDTHVMELFMMLHTARDLGANSIKVFVPYLAYSRQDERYLDWECLSSGMIAEMLEQLNVDTIYTVDIHNEKVLNMYKIPACNLTASGELAKYFAAKGLKDPFVVSPDDEEIAIKRARYAAKAINTDYNYFIKSRDRHTGEIITYPKQLDVQDRDAIIIDDIISTGRTSANAARILREQGARSVFVGVTHALLLGDALKILKESGVHEVAGTDCILNEHVKVSVAPILVNALKEGK